MLSISVELVEWLKARSKSFKQMCDLLRWSNIFYSSKSSCSFGLFFWCLPVSWNMLVWLVILASCVFINLAYCPVEPGNVPFTIYICLRDYFQRNGNEKLILSTALVSIVSLDKISVLFFISQPPTPLLMQINCLRRRISNIVFLFIRSCFLIMRPFNRPGAYCFAALWGKT